MVAFSHLFSTLVAQSILNFGLSPFTGSQPDNTTIVSSKPWLSLPPTPGLPKPHKGHLADVNGVKLWFNKYGHAHSGGSPVVFLHGGLGSSDYFGLQVKALMHNHQVIVVDSRGHGRSSRSADPMSYDLMTSDFVALLDHLGISKASFVGWSDGAINALNLAAKHPERVDRVFAFAANYNTNGTYDVTKSHVFMTYMERAAKEYARISPTPTKYQELMDDITGMWASQPNWTEETFKTINGTRVWIVDGDHEEAVRRDQQDQMAAWMPNAGLLILPQVSHFAFIQDAEVFNSVLKRFLAIEL